MTRAGNDGGVVCEMDFATGEVAEEGGAECVEGGEVGWWLLGGVSYAKENLGDHLGEG